MTEGPGRYLLSVSREGFITYTKELCVCKQSLDEIVVPLLPAVEESDTQAPLIRFFLSSDSGARQFSFSLLCPLSIFR